MAARDFTKEIARDREALVIGGPDYRPQCAHKDGLRCGVPKWQCPACKGAMV